MINRNILVKLFLTYYYILKRNIFHFYDNVYIVFLTIILWYNKFY